MADQSRFDRVTGNLASRRLARQVRPACRPAPRPTTWQFAVLRASRELSGDSKVLLAILWELDRGDGAFMNCQGLADQTGGHAVYVKQLRGQLCALGVVHQEQVPGSALDFWFVLPPDCEPEPPRGITPDERRRWVRAAADRYDATLRARRAAAEGKSSSLPPRALREEVLRREGRSSAADQRSREEVLNAEGRSSSPSEHATAPPTAPSVSLKGSATRSDSLPQPPESNTGHSRSGSGTQQRAARSYREMSQEERNALPPDVRAASEKLERKQREAAS